MNHSENAKQFLGRQAEKLHDRSTLILEISEGVNPDATLSKSQQKRVEEAIRHACTLREHPIELESFMLITMAFINTCHG
jgi:hypothetical protein